MKGRIGKVGIFMLALVFAIGAMGAAFASWTDQVSIEGQVNTGSLGYEVCGFSETWVYKVVGVYDDLPLGALVNSPVPIDDAALLYIAKADWTNQVPGMLTSCLQGHNQSFEVVFDNLFPCTWFKADIILHYIGSVPARLLPSMVFSDDPDSAWLEALWDMQVDPEFYMVAYRGSIPEGASEIVWESTPVDPEGLQMEFCDYLMIVWWLHIPQDNALMNKSARFTTTIGMVQWDKYGVG